MSIKTIIGKTILDVSFEKQSDSNEELSIRFTDGSEAIIMPAHDGSYCYLEFISSQEDK